MFLSHFSGFCNYSSFCQDSIRRLPLSLHKPCSTPPCSTFSSLLIHHNRNTLLVFFFPHSFFRGKKCTIKALILWDLVHGFFLPCRQLPFCCLFTWGGGRGRLGRREVGSKKRVEEGRGRGEEGILRSLSFFPRTYTQELM